MTMLKSGRWSNTSWKIRSKLPHPRGPVLLVTHKRIPKRSNAPLFLWSLHLLASTGDRLGKMVATDVLAIGEIGNAERYL